VFAGVVRDLVGLGELGLEGVAGLEVLAVQFEIADNCCVGTAGIWVEVFVTGPDDRAIVTPAGTGLPDGITCTTELGVVGESHEAPPANA
jgi:hypothetical protein